MRDRFALAALLGIAIAAFWFVYWSVGDISDVDALAFARPSVFAAFVVGVLAAPRVAASAASPENDRRGWRAGALLTLAAYVLGAVLWAVTMMFRTDFVADATITGPIVVVPLLSYLGVMAGIPLLLGALPFGMCAGRLFYEFRTSQAPGAV